MKLVVLVDKPLPTERPTGIGVAAFNTAFAMSNLGNEVYYVCRGRTEEVVAINRYLTVHKIKHYSRDNRSVTFDEMRKRDHSIFHVHSSSALPSLLLAKAHGHIAVTHVHGPPETMHPIRLTLMRNIEMNLSNVVIANSSTTKEGIIRFHRISPRKISIVYNGVDVQEFKPERRSVDVLSKYFLTQYDKILLSVGMVQQRKGQWRILECLPRILRQWPNLVYVNIGTPYDESYMNRLLERANSLGVDSHVKFLSNVSQQDLVALINASDLCLHPATLEGFGLAVVEEMACGKPVLAFNTESMPEIIDTGVDGLLAHPVNNESLLLSILSILENPELAKKLGIEARRKVMEKFTWDRAAMSLASIFSALDST